MMLMYVNQEIKTDLRFYRGANHEQVENSSMEISNELSKIKKLR